MVSPNGGDRRQILVVCDDDLVARDIRIAIESGGFHAGLTTSAPDALVQISRADPCLVVIDLGLPDSSGFQLLGQIRSTPASSRLPILSVTSIRHIENVQRAVKLGSSDVVITPFDSQALLDRIARCLSESGWRQRRRTALT